MERKDKIFMADYLFSSANRNGHVKTSAAFLVFNIRTTVFLFPLCSALGVRRSNKGRDAWKEETSSAAAMPCLFTQEGLRTSDEAS